MSYYVYGYLEFDSLVKPDAILEKISSSQTIEIGSMSEEELDGFPSHLLPEDAEKCIVFQISDWPGGNTADCLICGLDFALGSDIGVPISAAERMFLLLNLFQALLDLPNVTQLLVTLNDSGEVADVETCSKENFREMIEGCLDELYPPGLIYVIKNKMNIK